MRPLLPKNNIPTTRDVLARHFIEFKGNATCKALQPPNIPEINMSTDN